MRRYELTSLQGLTFQSWCVTRWEQQRVADCIRRWKKENPKANLEREILAETLIRLHVFEQRLVDRRLFFDGERSDYRQVESREVDVSTDDLNRQRREFDKYFEHFQKLKLEYLKLGLANSINVNVDGDITQLFTALDKKLSDNGSSNSAEAQDIFPRRDH